MVTELYYLYGMRLRGFSLGAQPQGVIKRFDASGLYSHYYDVIAYDHQLSDDDVEHYSLDLIMTTTTLDNLIMLEN